MDWSTCLKEHGVRPSIPRLAILKDLESHRTHPTAGEIYGRVKNEGISLASVYNTLKLLGERGVIRVIQIEDKELRYDIDTSFHAHFRCTKCGKIMDMSVSRRPSLTIPEGILVSQEDYYISGLCVECKENALKNETDGQHDADR